MLIVLSPILIYLTFVQVETLCVKLWLEFEMRAELDLRLTNCLLKASVSIILLLEVIWNS